jgi:hypothetical protein
VLLHDLDEQAAARMEVQRLGKADTTPGR